MALDNIEQLLEKYDNAETSLAEEAEIKDYFEKDDVPEHLESYRVLFEYVRHTKKEHFNKEAPLPTKRTKVYQWISIAAVAVIMLGLYFQVDQMNQKTTLADLSDKELMAYNQTIEVFNLVSSKFNQGSESFEALNLVSTKLNEGAENLIHLKEFNKTANKIIKNK